MGEITSRRREAECMGWRERQESVEETMETSGANGVKMRLSVPATFEHDVMIRDTVDSFLSDDMDRRIYHLKDARTYAIRNQRPGGDRPAERRAPLAKVITSIGDTLNQRGLFSMMNPVQLAFLVSAFLLLPWLLSEYVRAWRELIREIIAHVTQ